MGRRRRTSVGRFRFHRSSHKRWTSISRRGPAIPTHSCYKPRWWPATSHQLLRRHYKPAVTKAKLDPRTCFHDLRHTAAALMIAEGAHLLAVKQRLGHSSIQVTADRYGHLFPSLEDALTARLDESFRAAMARVQ